MIPDLHYSIFKVQLLYLAFGRLIDHFHLKSYQKVHRLLTDQVNQAHFQVPNHQQTLKSINCNPNLFKSLLYDECVLLAIFLLIIVKAANDQDFRLFTFF